MSAEVSPKEIANVLLALIREQQEDGRTALLSYLGLALSRHFKRPFRLLSAMPTLRMFIEKYLFDQVELIAPNPEHPLVIHAKIRHSKAGKNELPRQSASEGSSPPPHERMVDPAQLSMNLSTNSQTLKRFDPDFWAAFAKPIDPEECRYLRLERPFRFKDVPETQEAPDGRVLVEASFIAPREFARGPARTEFVTKQIIAWLEKTGLPQERFVDLGERPPRDEELRGSVPAILQLLADLEQTDLERIVIPADVWLKLLKL